jgi:hypothetical protein
MWRVEVASGQGGNLSEFKLKYKRAADKNILPWTILFLILVIMSDAYEWSNHGGIISVMSAISSARIHAGSVNMPSRGFDTLSIAALAIVGLICCRLLELDPTSRPTVAIVAACVLGGSFILNESFGKPWITQFMAAHGYMRCPLNDHVAGNGKGRVWFANYVSNREACPSRPIGRTEP